MRYRLLRFVSLATNWEPKFALETIDVQLVAEGCLLQQPLLTHHVGGVLTFDTIRDAVQWVCDNDYNNSLEWEGTTF